MIENNFGMKGYLRMHNAIRRDLERLESKAVKLTNPGMTQVLKLEKWFNFYWEMVEHHHKGEDRGAFPMLAKIDPVFASHVPVLTFDHNEIDRIVDEIKANFAFIRLKEPLQVTSGSYRQLVIRLVLLRQSLSNHLKREEAAFIPAVARNFTLQQQRAIEQGIYKRIPARQLAVMVPWTLQYLDAEERGSALAELSSRFRYLYNVSWQKRYERLALTFNL